LPQPHHFPDFLLQGHDLNGQPELLYLLPTFIRFY
jgi:hypothetical protein